MFDFHSHILPGIDDGSKSVNMSLRMLQESVNQGVSGIILTPHFYADQDTPEDFLQKRARAIARLDNHLYRLRRSPELLVGAEVHYFHGMGRSSVLEQLCIGRSNLLLLEMPFTEWSARMLQDVEEIHSILGLQVIIAHIERYLAMQDPRTVEALFEMRVLVQANAEFFIQRGTRRKAIKMLERREINLLDSDSHNLTTRAPNLGQATKYIQKKLGDSALNRLDRLGTRLFRAAGAVV